MSMEAWVTIGIAVASGFGAWLFRIDRGIQKLGYLTEDIHEIKTTVEAHGVKLEHHGTKLARLETKLEKP